MVTSYGLIKWAEEKLIIDYIRIYMSKVLDRVDRLRVIGFHKKGAVSSFFLNQPFVNTA